MNGVQSASYTHHLSPRPLPWSQGRPAIVIRHFGAQVMTHAAGDMRTEVPYPGARILCLPASLLGGTENGNALDNS